MSGSGLYVWGSLWVLHLEGMGLTQARSTRGIEAMVIDYVSLMRGEPVGGVRVDVFIREGPGSSE